jgi:outer membrane protein OmpA-like peptidoglycan-associated protein
MKSTKLLVVIACAGLLGACAHNVPKELVNARSAYRSSAAGVTAQVAPAELHVANLALARAEQSFKDDPESYQTRDLSYVAWRKVQLADATASISIEKESQAQSKDDYQATQGQIIASTKQDLSQTNTALAASEHAGAVTAVQLSASEHAGAMTAQQLSAEKAARAAADKRAADAMAALAKLAAVKDEPRGMVITLSGSVLFASNQSTLLPEARTRLDQVAAVLLTTRERHLTVEGHTDSQGTDNHNMDLSQRRADAVRTYLVGKDYGADLIQANGMGEGSPVADNGNAEGRANNRRVEIIIERDPSASGKISSNQ